jgi:hypothetical protein
MSDVTEEIAANAPPVLPLNSFLETVAPGSLEQVHIKVNNSRAGPNNTRVGDAVLPAIELHCDSAPCGGLRMFANFSDKPTIVASDGREQSSFWTFTCRNCRKTKKSFAVQIRCINSAENHYALEKYGEIPAFGTPLPRRLLDLAGSERDYLFKGRRCEDQGLGIAAFAYYRRVLDARRDQLFAEIIRVCHALNVESTIIQDLEAARKERQFTSAVDKIKHALPSGLMVNGHNPLTLLYDALSDGLHAGTDSECLELATIIRKVLSELMERLSQSLKEDAELTKAVSKLLERKSRAR